MASYKSHKRLYCHQGTSWAGLVLSGIRMALLRSDILEWWTCIATWDDIDAVASSYTWTKHLLGGWAACMQPREMIAVKVIRTFLTSIMYSFFPVAFKTFDYLSLVGIRHDICYGPSIYSLSQLTPNVNHGLNVQFRLIWFCCWSNDCMLSVEWWTQVSDTQHPIWIQRYLNLLNLNCCRTCMQTIFCFNRYAPASSAVACCLMPCEYDQVYSQ